MPLRGPQAPRAGGRQYPARQTTADTFSRTWVNIGDISPMDKIECLERCESFNFNKSRLHQYSQDPDSLDALVYYATGWQPGHSLFERSRDEFYKYFQREHAARSYPLRAVTPEDALAQVKAAMGVEEKDEEAYSLSVCPQTGHQVLSNGVSSEYLPAGHAWALQPPPPGCGMDCAWLTDGKLHVLQGHFPSSRTLPEGRGVGLQDWHRGWATSWLVRRMPIPSPSCSQGAHLCAPIPQPDPLPLSVQGAGGLPPPRLVASTASPPPLLASRVPGLWRPRGPRPATGARRSILSSIPSQDVAAATLSDMVFQT